MGSIVTTVAAERTVTGVTAAVAVLPPVVALPHPIFFLLWFKLMVPSIS